MEEQASITHQIQYGSRDKREWEEFLIQGSLKLFSREKFRVEFHTIVLLIFSKPK